MNILKTLSKKPQKGFSIAFGVMLTTAMILGIYLAMSDRIISEELVSRNSDADKSQNLSQVSAGIKEYYEENSGKIDSIIEPYSSEKLNLIINADKKYDLKFVSTKRMYRTDLCNNSLKVNTPDCIEYHDFYVWLENEKKPGSTYKIEDKEVASKGIYTFIPPLINKVITGVKCDEGKSVSDGQDPRCFVPFTKISGFNIQSEKVGLQIANLQKLAQGLENYAAVKRKQNPTNNSLINYFRQEDGSYSGTFVSKNGKTEFVNRNDECGGALQPHSYGDARYSQQIPCIANPSSSFQKEYVNKTGKTSTTYGIPNTMITTDAKVQELDVFDDLRDLYDPLVYSVGLEPVLLKTVWADTSAERSIYFSNTGRSNYKTYPYSASFVALAPWFDGKNKIDGKPNGMYEIKAVVTE